MQQIFFTMYFLQVPILYITLVVILQKVMAAEVETSMPSNLRLHVNSGSMVAKREDLHSVKLLDKLYVIFIPVTLPKISNKCCDSVLFGIRLRKINIKISYHYIVRLLAACSTTLRVFTENIYFKKF
jgi:hypothetical protein